MSSSLGFRFTDGTLHGASGSTFVHPSMDTTKSPFAVPTTIVHHEDSWTSASAPSSSYLLPLRANPNVASLVTIPVVTAVSVVVRNDDTNVKCSWRAMDMCHTMYSTDGMENSDTAECRAGVRDLHLLTSGGGAGNTHHVQSSHTRSEPYQQGLEMSLAMGCPAQP